MKILIVDDEEMNRYFLETCLKSAGYAVLSARNGSEALEKLKSKSIDMIISDILMPKMDGFQLCKTCKANNTLKDIPFLFISSSYIDKKDEEFAMRLGAERLVVRPIECLE